MISTTIYNNQNFPIPTEKVFEKLFALEEPLNGQSVTIKSIFNTEDKTPSMIIYYSEENIYRFKDFSTGRYGDMTDIITQMYGITSRQDAYKKIISLFKNEEYTAKKATTLIKKELTEVTDFKIRQWNINDQEFWKSFSIGGSFLKKYNVKPLSEYKMEIVSHGKKHDMIFNNPMSYGYFNKENELCKIYNPQQKKGKFLKVKEFIQGEEQIEGKGLILLIVASLKEIGAFKSMKYKDVDLVAPDSENVDIPEEKLNEYKKNYKYVFALFDNDVAGMKAMKKYKDLYGISYIYFTIEDDLADCVKEHGPNNTKIFLTPILKDAIRKENIRLNKKQ